MSSSAEQSKVSFTIRRPTPSSSRATSTGPDTDGATPPSASRALPSFKIPALPRHLTDEATASRSASNSPKPNARTFDDRGQESDSSEEERTEDELVTGFDQFGVQRANGERKKPAGPLVIPALANKDWRALARQRRGGKQPSYVPASGAATTGADGSQGGLGTKDFINSGPELRGLQVRKKVKLEADGEDVKMEEETLTTVPMSTDAEIKTEDDVKEEPETEDQRAIRLLLAGDDGSAEPVIDIIPPPVSETEAYQQDVEALPESATLADYERVPVSQFGAALLRGMGWTPDGPAGKGKHLQGKKAVEPYLPTARPALLGLGAKEREVVDDGDPRKKKFTRPEKRYVPVVRRGGDDGERPSRRGSPEGDGRRRGERSGEKDKGYDDRDKDRDRDRERRGDRDRDDHRRDDRDRDYDRRRHDDERDRRRNRDGDGERDRRSSRKDDGYDKHRRRDRSREEYRSSKRRD